MAHDVNQSETEFAAQVRSALVSKISAERLDLWIPDSTEWCWHDNQLDLLYSDELRCQVASSALSHEIKEVLYELGFADATVNFSRRPEAAQKDVVERQERDRPLVQAVHLDRKADQFNSDVHKVEIEPASKQLTSSRGVSSPIASRRGSIGLRNAVSTAELTDGRETAATPSNVSPVHAASSAQGLPPKQTEPVSQSVAEVHPPHASPSLVRRRETDSRPRSTNGNVVTEQEHKPVKQNIGLENWERFLPGTSNHLAWGAAKLVIESPGQMTPVFLHGPSGVGKSLLATGMAEYLRVVRRMRRVVHLSSEQFLNDFTEGLRGGGLPMFRRKYRDVEALILEDIQFFAGKKSSISEVKNTLDNLLRLGKQVVFTADRSVNDLQALGGELTGRIRGGLTVPVFPLDETLRFRILKRETERAGISIDAEILQDIASQVTGDGRVLSGIAKRLLATAAMEGNTLDHDRCWTAIHDLVQATRPIVRIVDIDRVVCDVFGLEPESLKSSSKIRRVSQPRMLAMFLARKYTPAAYKEIGQYFGRRRHSTVISAEKTVESWLGENSDLDCGSGMKIREAIRHVESQLQVG